MKDNDTISKGFKMTGFSLLPEEWKVVKLGDVSKVSSGGSAPQGDEYFDGENPFVRVQHIDRANDTIIKWDLITDDAVRKYKLKLYPKGVIVFPKSGASIYLEKRAKLPIDAYIVGHLCAVVSNNPLLSQDFLFYELKFIKLSKDKADGYPILNLSEIKDTKISFPPLPEQKKIAAVLSTVQEAKEKAEVVIKAAKELKKSLMKHLFTYGPVSLEDAKEVKLKDTETGRIRDEWEVIPANKVFCQITDGTHDTPKKLSEGFPLIKSKQIKNGRVDVSNADYFISEEDYQYVNKRSKVDKCDILFSMIGTVGEVALIEDEPTFAIKNVGLFKSNYDLDLTTYCYHWLQSEKAKKHTSKNLSGTSQKYITLAKLRDFPILFPDKSVREKISSILSSVDKKIETEENKKKALEELFKTLLNNLMTAEIRVNHLGITV